MNRRIVSWFLLTALCLSLCPAAPAEGAPAPFSFNGASWGINKTQIRWLMGVQPIQDVSDLGGRSAMIYQTKIEDFRCAVQYGFLADGSLYNIEVAVPEDIEMAFYDLMEEQFTEQYGEPLTEDDASLESDSPAAVMMATLMKYSTDGDYLAWQADPETVIVLSFDTDYDICYVEIRRYTDYFSMD